VKIISDTPKLNGWMHHTMDECVHPIVGTFGDFGGSNEWNWSAPDDESGTFFWDKIIYKLFNFSVNF